MIYYDYMMIFILYWWYEREIISGALKNAESMYLGSFFTHQENRHRGIKYLTEGKIGI